MRRKIVITAFFAILLGVPSLPASAEKNCQLTQYASLALGTDPGGGVYVPVEINSVPENMLVDTGGIASMLTESTIHELRLPYELLSGGRLVFMPGASINYITHAEIVRLGSMQATHVPFLVMPDHKLPAGESGTLAPDIMSNYDVEFDFAKAQFKLFSPDHCPEQVVYWTHEPYAEIPVQMDTLGHISTTVQLDGKSIPALLDTGSSRSAMNFEAASDLFGWKDKTADLTVTSRRKDDTPGTYHFPFKTLALSGVTVNNPDVILFRQLSNEDFRIGTPTVRFILGMGVLRQLHLYLAYHERKLYVTAAGAH